VIALLQAGRGRVCWARYTHGPDGWHARGPLALSTAGGLADALDEPVVFAGELSPADRGILTRQLGDRARCLPPALAMRRAGCLAELAWLRFAAGERDDAAALSPIYLQEPVTFPQKSRS
jgi:tRNA threonylcarbamoyladenosine biosynthesis protein TsaB